MNWDNAEIMFTSSPKGTCVACGNDIYLSGLCESCYTIHANSAFHKTVPEENK